MCVLAEFVYGRNNVRVTSGSSSQFKNLPKPLQKSASLAADVALMRSKMDEHVARQREDDDVKWRDSEYSHVNIRYMYHVLFFPVEKRLSDFYH